MIQAEVIIRGDLLRTLPASITPGEGREGRDGKGNAAQNANSVAVAIGRYCFFSRGCELRPPGKFYRGFVFLLLHFNSFTFYFLDFIFP